MLALTDALCLVCPSELLTLPRGGQVTSFKILKEDLMSEYSPSGKAKLKLPIVTYVHVAQQIPRKLKQHIFHCTGNFLPFKHRTRLG